MGDALFAEFDLLGAVGVSDDDAGHAHRAVLVFEFGEVRDVIGFGAHGRTQRGNTLGGEHGFRAHRAGERNENHDVQRIRDGLRTFDQIVAQRLAWSGRVVQAEHEGVELMAGGYAMESHAGEDQ